MIGATRRAWAIWAAAALAACGDGTGESPDGEPRVEAPVLFATATRLATPEDQPLTFPLTVTAAAAASVSATVIVATPPQFGSLAQAGNRFTYTPDPDFNGTDRFEFFGTAGGRTSNTARATIAVTPVNDPPTALGLFLATDQGVPAMGMLAGDDPDGDSLTFNVIGGSNDGTIAFNAGTGAFTFTPDAAFSGETQFNYIARDGVSDSAIATVTILVLDTEPPALATVNIAGGAITTTTADVTVALVADADAAQMQITGDVVDPGPAWRPFAAAFNVTLTPGDGVKSVWVRVRDQFDNAGAVVGDSVMFDASGPAVTFDFPAFTSSTTVVIDVDASDPSPPIQMNVAGDITGASVATSTYVPWQTPVTVFLTAGEAVKTVTFSLRDQFLQTSGPFELDIVLDQTPPTVAVTPATDITNQPALTLTIVWSDTTAPVTAITLRGDIDPQQLLTAFNPFSATSGTIQFWPVNLSAGDGVKAITATAIDAAGNTSTPFMATVTLDTLPPSLSAVTLAGGAAAVSDPSIGVDLTVSGDAFEMRVTGPVGGGIAGQWRPFFASSLITLTGSDGLKTVWVDVRDAQGNATAAVSDTVSLDRTPPTLPAFVTAANLATDVVVTWADVADAAFYEVHYDTDAAGAPYANVMTLAAPATSVTLTGFAADVTVYVALRLGDALANRSGFSTEAVTTTTALPQLTGVVPTFATFVMQMLQTLRVDGEPGDRMGAAMTKWSTPDGEGGVIGAPGGAAGAGVVIGLVNTLVFAVTVTDGAGALGSAVATGADLDGDGTSDVFAGAMSADSGGVDAGAVFALAGTDGSVLWRRDGDVLGAGLGAALAVWPQPGGAWLAAAAPMAASGGDLNSGFVDVLNVSNGALLQRLWGTAGAEFGTVLAPLATTATAVLVVGAPGGAAGAGEVIAFAADFVERWRVTGTTIGERLGVAAAAVGDIDGDGYEDVAVGAASDADGAVDRGAVVLLRGVDGSVLWRTEGALAGDNFGAAVAPAGNLDADAVPDVYVTAPGVTTLGGVRGRMYALSGSDGSTIALYDGPTVPEDFGRAMFGFDGINTGQFVVGIGAPAADANGVDSGSIYGLLPTGPQRAAAPATTLAFALRGNTTVTSVDVRVAGATWTNVADWRRLLVANVPTGGPHAIAFRPRDAKGAVGVAQMQAWAVDVSGPTVAVTQPATPVAVTNSVTIAGIVTDPVDGDGVGGLIGGIEWAAKVVTAPNDLWWDGEAFAWPAPRWFFTATTEVWSFAAPFTGAGQFEVRVRGLDGSFVRSAAPVIRNITYQP